MKRIGILAVLLLALVAGNAQTTVNDNNARAREVGSFTAVKVSQGIELLLQQGDKDAVAVSSSNPEYQERIKTVVEAGMLRIFIDDRSGSSNWRRGVKFKAYVSIRQLEKLVASSGASVKTGNVIKAGKLDVDASSGAVIDAEFKAESIYSDNSSGSVTTLKGNVESLKVESSSGSLFKGYDLSATNCDADVSSGGSISITVTKELNAEASSGGEIKYKGAGTIRKLHTSSGGAVRSNG